MFVLKEERNPPIEDPSVDSPTAADIKECASSSSKRPRNTSNHEDTSSTSVQKKKKEEMTAYEEALLEFQKEKYKMAMEFMQIEHEAKLKSISTEHTHRQQLHELQMKELLLRIKKYKNDDM
ncbi:unnamed protein product [Lasius platythorax]|uniref:Uncharacterized protein n=1 Tax=Lasius platythorax TaxID=488582 RepID=A0AAV2ND64_9HYME